VLPLGGAEGCLLEALLEDAGVPYAAVPIRTTTRSNVTLSEPSGAVTKINAPGGPLEAVELDALVAAIVPKLSGTSWLVCCGSLPQGAPVTFYATLTDRAHAAGVAVAIDASGEPLAAAIEAGPELIKPNLDELIELVGRPLMTLDEIVEAAEEVRARGVGAVVVSLGARGAVLVDGDTPTLAVPPALIARSDVGAGDTLLAGFLAAGGIGAQALRAGVAWSAAAVALPGTSVPTPEVIDVDSVSVWPAAPAADART
jgi:1-phosphofructokinase